MSSGSNYKAGLPPLLLCMLLWGFQPLYWHFCPDTLDTLLLATVRTVSAAVFCLVILAVQGKLGQILAVFKDRQILKREIPATLFLAADWFVYLFAVQNGKVQQCSLGYYIMPLVQFVFGAVIFREKLERKHIFMLIPIVAGIVLSTEGFNGFPYVTMILAFAFAIYAAIKKSLTVDSIVSTTAEILIMAPFALAYVLLSPASRHSLTSLNAGGWLLMAGAGVVTALPMLLYALGVKYLPLMTCGLLEYLSPTFSLFASFLMGETFNSTKFLSFLFIWIGVAMYVAYLIRDIKRKQVSA